jgi:hypothetical protein
MLQATLKFGGVVAHVSAAVSGKLTPAAVRSGTKLL